MMAYGWHAICGPLREAPKRILVAEEKRGGRVERVDVKKGGRVLVFRSSKEAVDIGYIVLEGFWRVWTADLKNKLRPDGWGWAGIKRTQKSARMTYKQAP